MRSGECKVVFQCRNNENRRATLAHRMRDHTIVIREWDYTHAGGALDFNNGTGSWDMTADWSILSGFYLL